MLFALAIAAILIVNDGRFTYTLDAPYTHLALAEHILHGTYGLNPGEPAAPSSTVLFPFMLVPLLGLGQYGPLLINITATLGTGLAACALATACGIRLERVQPVFLAAITLTIGCSLNLIGVALTGLEHPLHVLLTLLSLLGLVRFLQRGQSDWWWLLTIILLPLIRFESMSAVLTDAFVLFMFGNRRYAALALCAGFSLVLLFALFLHSQGLPYLPTSVTARSQVASSGLGMQQHHGLAAILHSAAVMLKQNLLRFGATHILLMMVLAGWCLRPFLARTGLRLRGLAPNASGMVAVGSAAFVTPAAAGFFILIAAAQLLAGSLQSAGRYEVYLLGLGAGTLMVCYRERVATFVEEMRLGGCIAVCLAIATLFAGYLVRDIEDVRSAETVYAGSFQVRRFIVNDYKRDFATTRPGLIKYQNPYRMLDLSGLASVEAQLAMTHHAPGDTEWMDTVTRGRGIGLVVMFADTHSVVPRRWTPLAELRARDLSLGVDGGIATFYAADSSEQPRILACLRRFQHTLPDRDVLQIFGGPTKTTTLCD